VFILCTPSSFQKKWSFDHMGGTVFQSCIGVVIKTRRCMCLIVTLGTPCRPYAVSPYWTVALDYTSRESGVFINMVPILKVIFCQLCCSCRTNGLYWLQQFPLFYYETHCIDEQCVLMPPMICHCLKSKRTHQPSFYS